MVIRVALHLKSLLGHFGIPPGATFDKTLHYIYDPRSRFLAERLVCRPSVDFSFLQYSVSLFFFQLIPEFLNFLWHIAYCLDDSRLVYFYGHNLPFPKCLPCLQALWMKTKKLLLRKRRSSFFLEPLPPPGILE